MVVLNDIAKTIIEQQRGNHNRFVFAHCHRGVWRPMYTMGTNGWKAAPIRAGIPNVRVHDLRHKSSRMTTHYSAAEIKNLIKDYFFKKAFITAGIA